ncbi:hypothetical protein [Candidatus Uabimicrobium sp. HlEnr_7]|uniref:hypothetical protein n=1 Tax=Candidatus Uabimicrobium helgolandensis TaxID=3095367 RepID=UPI003557B6A1
MSSRNDIKKELAVEELNELLQVAEVKHSIKKIFTRSRIFMLFLFTLILAWQMFSIINLTQKVRELENVNKTKRVFANYRLSEPIKQKVDPIIHFDKVVNTDNAFRLTKFGLEILQRGTYVVKANIYFQGNAPVLEIRRNKYIIGVEEGKKGSEPWTNMVGTTLFTFEKGDTITFTLKSGHSISVSKEKTNLIIERF